MSMRRPQSSSSPCARVQATRSRFPANPGSPRLGNRREGQEPGALLVVAPIVASPSASGRLTDSKAGLPTALSRTSRARHPCPLPSGPVAHRPWTATAAMLNTLGGNAARRPRGASTVPAATTISRRSASIAIIPFCSSFLPSHVLPRHRVWIMPIGGSLHRTGSGAVSAGGGCSGSGARRRGGGPIGEMLTTLLSPKKPTVIAPRRRRRVESRSSKNSSSSWRVAAQRPPTRFNPLLWASLAALLAGRRSFAFRVPQWGARSRSSPSRSVLFPCRRSRAGMACLRRFPRPPGPVEVARNASQLAAAFAARVAGRTAARTVLLLFVFVSLSPIPGRISVGLRVHETALLSWDVSPSPTGHAWHPRAQLANRELGNR